MAGPIETVRVALKSEPAKSLDEANARINEICEKLSEQRQRELALLRFEKTVETMQLGVTVTDVDGVIVYVNPADAALHGYGVDELIGQHASIFADPVKRDPLNVSDIDKLTSWQRECLNLRKDGSTFSARLMSDVVRDSRGVPVGVVTTCEDVSDRRKTEEALRDSEQRYALAASGASVGLWDWDCQSGVVFYSSRWKTMMGFEDDEVAQSIEEWTGRIHPDDRDRVDAEIETVINAESSYTHFESEHRLLHKTGSYRWFLCTAVIVKDDSGTTLRMVGSKQDITERKRVEQQLLEDAFHDALTGLPNRSLFQSMVDRCIGRSRRRQDYLFAVMILDLDRFKIVNDSLGHTTGDKLLVGISRRLKPCLRPSDTLARFGGDQFGILLEDMRDPSDPNRVARRIQEQLGRAFKVEGREVFLTASIGIASSVTGYDDATALVRDADTAMHRSKARGTSRFEVFDADMRQQAVERLQLETDLRNVVANKELRTYYQPILTLGDERLVGFEALLRWQHPNRGLLSPAEFIPVAEETDLIVPMGWWILEDACRQMKRWHGNVDNAQALGVSVNLSGRQLLQGDVLDNVRGVLDDTGLPEGTLRLEMTETVMMEGGERSTQLCNSLKDLAVPLYMDDFGTGYSSLSYLHSFPLDLLKIDRSFVARMTEQQKFEEIVRAIINMAHNLGMKVVAEGVETARQVTLLNSFGCDFVQGFYYSEPLEAANAEEFIASHKTF